MGGPQKRRFVRYLRRSKVTNDDIMATASHYSEVDAQGYVRFTEDDLINFVRSVAAEKPAVDELTDQQIEKALEDAGVKWQWVGMPMSYMATVGSTPAPPEGRRSMKLPDPLLFDGSTKDGVTYDN